MVWKNPRKANENIKWRSGRKPTPPPKPIFDVILPEHKIYFDVLEFLAWLSDQPENMELKVNHKTLNALELAKLNPGFEKVIGEVCVRFIGEVMTPVEPEPE